MILSNKRGLSGKDTTNVMIPFSTFNALCNIEANFDSNETYTMVKQGKERQRHLYHITNSDLQTFLTLHKICSPVKGTIHHVRKHTIYKKLDEYFEKPISIGEFYNSMDKFVQLDLISMIYDKATNLYTYQINHYQNKDTKKPGYFGIVSAVVFTEAFHKLTIGQKKLFVSLAIQNNSNKPRPFIRNFKEASNDKIQYNLKSFLHRQDSYHIKQMIEELQTTSYKETPFIKSAKYIKKGKRLEQVELLLHEEWLKDRETSALHDMITPVQSYSKKSLFLRKVLRELGLNELATINDGLDFLQLLKMFRSEGYRMIRYILNQIKDFVSTHGQFPAHIISFVSKRIRVKREASISDVAQKTGIDKWIAPKLTGEDKAHREGEFYSFMSRYSMSEIKDGFNKAKEHLKLLYGKPFKEIVRFNHYHCHHSNQTDKINQSPYIHVLRSYAFNNQLDPDDYAAFELYAYNKIKQTDKTEINKLMDTLLSELDNLNSVDIVPDTPEQWSLEYYLQKYGWLKMKNPLMF